MFVIFSSLLPIFLVIGLGAVLRQSGFLPFSFFSGLNRLAFYVGLPALLFSRIATSPLEGGPALRIFNLLLITIIIITIISYLLSYAGRLSAPQRGSFIQATIRGNLAFIGLPVIIYTGIEHGMAPEKIETAAMLALAPAVPLFNILAVLVLTHNSNDKKGASYLLTSTGKVITNPILLACLGGIIFAWLQWPLPTLIERTLNHLGQMALPLALLAIGASLSISKLKSRITPTLVAAFIKTGLTPLIGFVVASLIFNLTATELRIALILLACPTAISSYIMVQQLGGDEQLAGGAIMASTLLSLLSLATVIFLTA